jgi:hypothetical protein
MACPRIDVDSFYLEHAEINPFLFILIPLLDRREGSPNLTEWIRIFLLARPFSMR